MPQQYKVSGTSKVFGLEPGTTFERKIDPVQEERLLKGGAITKVRRSPAKPKPEQAKTPASADTKE